jgi:hypothetical protein
MMRLRKPVSSDSRMSTWKGRIASGPSLVTVPDLSVAIAGVAAAARASDATAVRIGLSRGAAVCVTTRFSLVFTVVFNFRVVRPPTGAVARIGKPALPSPYYTSHATLMRLL